MVRPLMITFVILALGSCQTNSSSSENSPKPTSENIQKANNIIEQVIKKHGGERYQNATINFTFRNRQYQSIRNGSRYVYSRMFTEENGNQIEDILTNDSFVRKVNGEEVSLSEKKKSSYSNSVNSVIYFALLPYFLQDEAVQSQYLGEASIKGQPYHKLKVTFRQEGGGKDFEDEYVYWIHKDHLTMDYLAYNYVVDGGGARFRSAYNVRTIEGIRFADYINHKPNTGTRAVETFDALYEEGKLEELSKIESEDIHVTLNSSI